MSFLCKQKTAYEMRISDWSPDVCSSDLLHRHVHDLADLLGVALRKRTAEDGEILAEDEDQSAVDRARPGHHPVAGYLRLFHAEEIGRASCRDRVCQSV